MRRGADAAAAGASGRGEAAGGSAAAAGGSSGGGAAKAAKPGAAPAEEAAAAAAGEEEAGEEEEEWESEEEEEDDQPWWAVEGALDSSATTIFLARRCFSFRHRVSPPRDTRGFILGEDGDGGHRHAEGAPSDGGSGRGNRRHHSLRGQLGTSTQPRRGPLKRANSLTASGPCAPTANGRAAIDGSDGGSSRGRRGLGRSQTFGSSPSGGGGGAPSSRPGSGRSFLVHELTSGQVLKSLRSVAASSSRRGARALSRFSSLGRQHPRRALSADPYLCSMRDAATAIVDGGRRLLDEEKVHRAKHEISALSVKNGEDRRGGRKRSESVPRGGIGGKQPGAKADLPGGSMSAPSAPPMGVSARSARQEASRQEAAQLAAAAAGIRQQQLAAGGSNNAPASAADKKRPTAAGQPQQQSGSFLARLFGCFGPSPAAAGGGSPGKEAPAPVRGRV